MEFNKIEGLLEKYFETETSIAEENELRCYFTSSKVEPHLEQYRPLFDYFVEAKNEKFTQNVNIVSNKRKIAWLSIAASIVVLSGIGTYAYFNTNEVNESQELGTYDDPKKALEATQKALTMLSNHVNIGVEGVQYIQVYKVTKDRIFIE